MVRLADLSFEVLDVLAIAEDYWRKGVGTKLLQSGIKIAESAGLDIFLQGRKEGVGFYSKFGFEVLDQVVPDDPRLEGETSVFLLRKS